MTDRELLELAAKAIGFYRFHPARRHHSGVGWNPLADDGDALRLAVDLWIEIRVFNGQAHAGKQNKFWCTEPVGDDPHAATRRAIVRAAAEIGKGTT